mmetsp:Transcript_7042/g.11767  ORF Transcript_7042/g.11767 Transcript_7042/m.11767 type:complete len:123 (-) Transcript_7042:1144-1512(-)
MIFGGSSVTAGHDNLPGQAYPHVIEKKMAPIFDTLGIIFKVYNIAQGANACTPSDMCYSSMGGYSADVVGWEQTFNCGTTQRKDCSQASLIYVLHLKYICRVDFVNLLSVYNIMIYTLVCIV